MPNPPDTVLPLMALSPVVAVGTPSMEAEPNRLVCLAMGDLHGDAFRRVVTTTRPQVVVDVRRHPYFGLPSLNRQAALRHVADAGTIYVHRHLAIRHLPTGGERWRLRTQVAEFLEALVPVPGAAGMSFVILTHAVEEATVLRAAVQGIRISGGAAWAVEAA